MVNYVITAVITASFLWGPAHAASDAQKAQQNKMAVCNKEAGDKKGDERKAFMKECLSNKPVASEKHVSEAQKAQQEKMKTCNAEAQDKKGDERKKFMSECLKK